MDRYYAIYELGPLQAVQLPAQEGDGELFPGSNPFIPLVSGEVNLSLTEGDATIAPPTRPWTSNPSFTANLSQTEGDGTLYPGESPFSASAAAVINLDSTEGDGSVPPGENPWASNALATENLGATEGDGTVYPGTNAFIADAADAQNLYATEGDSTAYPGENAWTSLAGLQENLPQTEGDGSVYPGENPWASVTGSIVNLPATEGDGTLIPAENAWSSNPTGTVNLSRTEGDATLYPGQNAWTSVSATEINLGATEGDGTLYPGQNAFSVSAAGIVNLPATEGDGTLYPGENIWSSLGLSEINLGATEGDSTLYPGENAWTSGAAGAVNLDATEGDGTLYSGENQWASSGADVVNLGATEGDGTVSPGENPWASSGAAVVNLGATEGDGTVAPGENAFSTDASDAVNLGATEGDGELVPGENPFTPGAGGPVQRAICFSGTVSTPGYMASDTILGKYNGLASNGYISLWYKYTGSDVAGDFLFDNVLFTVWGDTEGDRLEFGLISGVSQNIDVYVKTSGPSGFNYVRAILGSIDLADGSFHHIMIGGNGSAWWFYVDGSQELNLDVESGANVGDWFSQTQGIGSHEIDAAATRVSGANNGTDFLQGCIDELMVVNDRNHVTHPNDPVYLYNGGNGIRIPEAESDNQDGLWDDTFNGWRFNSDNPGEEYVDGIHNFTTIEGNVGTDGIPGKIPYAAIQTAVGSNRSGLVVDYADKIIPAHNGDFTVAAWVKPDTTTPANDMGVATKLYNGASEWALWYDAAQERFRGTAWTPTGQSFCYPPTYTVAAGTWYMVAIRIAYLSQGFRFSIGAETGGLAHGTPTGVNLTPDGTASILIGMYGYDQQIWDGAIDDVSYWNRYLSDADLDDLFALGAGIPYESYTGSLLVNLIMQFNMNECCGTRFDGHGTNVGVDGKLYKGQPIPGKEPLAVQGHIT